MTFNVRINLLGGCIPCQNDQQISKCAVSYPALLALENPTSFHLIVKTNINNIYMAFAPRSLTE